MDSSSIRTHLVKFQEYFGEHPQVFVLVQNYDARYAGFLTAEKVTTY